MRSLQQIRRYYKCDELPNYNFTVLSTHSPCLITFSKVANLFSCQKNLIKFVLIQIGLRKHFVSCFL